MQVSYAASLEGERPVNGAERTRGKWAPELWIHLLQGLINT